MQSLASLELVYGRTRAQVLRDTVETQLYFRPTDTQTARYLEERLGNVSGYAHSQTLHNGQEASEGRSERPIPLLASQDITLLPDTAVLAFHRDNRAMRISRLEWFYHPILAKRRAFPPPKLPALPALSEEFPQRRGEEQTGGDFWRLERELLHGKKSSSLTNGFRKQGKSL